MPRDLLTSHCDRGPGHVRLGRLLLAWPVRQGYGADVIDGCSTTLERVEKGELVEKVSYGGVVVRPWWRPNGLSVTWRGARVPNPARWLHWRFVKARVLWILDGRPARGEPVTTVGNDGVAHRGYVAR